MLASLGADGPGLRFRLLGFPVRIDWSFLLIAALLGLGADLELGFFLTWVGVVGASVLVHELGHAFAARALGAEPTITLHAVGGLTAFSPPRPPTRWQSVGVSVAGPAAGAAVGLGILAGEALVGAPPEGTAAWDVLWLAKWINIGWGLVNLAPVLPLDGGAVLEALLPGDPLTRHTWAVRVSVVAGVVAAVGLWLVDVRFGGFLFGMLVVMNLSSARGMRRLRHEQELSLALDELAADPGPATIARLEPLVLADPDPKRRTAVCSTVVDWLLAHGEAAEARRFVDSMRGTVDASLVDLLLVHEGDPGGHTRLTHRVLTEPSVLAARSLVRASVYLGTVDELPALLAELPRGGTYDDARHEVVRQMLRAGHPDAAEAIGPASDPPRP